MATATTGFNYDYVFDLALRLSPEEQGRLLRELPNSTASGGGTKNESFLSESDAVPYSHEDFYNFLLSGPVIDKEHIQLMAEAREEVNRCQPISW